MVAQPARLRQSTQNAWSESYREELIEALEQRGAGDAEDEVEAAFRAVAMTDEVDDLRVQWVHFVGAWVDQVVVVLAVDARICKRNHVVCLPDQVADHAEAHVWANLRTNCEPTGH